LLNWSNKSLLLWYWEGFVFRKAHFGDLSEDRCTQQDTISPFLKLTVPKGTAVVQLVKELFTVHREISWPTTVFTTTIQIGSLSQLNPVHAFHTPVV
jgi:hypothetical protein